MNEDIQRAIVALRMRRVLADRRCSAQTGDIGIKMHASGERFAYDEAISLLEGILDEFSEDLAATYQERS